jgi:hypothetical protein
MRSRNVVFVVFVVLLLGLGIFVGFSLAGYQKLAPYKLLNIVGIVYGLLGLIVLSELVATSERVKFFMVHWVAATVLWASSVVPLGGLIGATIGHSLPSSEVTGKFFGTFFAYSLAVLTLLEIAVVNPKPKRLALLTTRHQLFGLLLLLSGAIAQLVAAVQDLNT